MRIQRILQLEIASAALAVGVLTLLGSANAVTNPTSANSPSGATIYAQKCTMCHAKDGGGLPAWRAKGQPSFADADWQKGHSDAQVFQAIKSGKGKYMPPFKDKLSDEEIGAVVAQIRRFGK